MKRFFSAESRMNTLNSDTLDGVKNKFISNDI